MSGDFSRDLAATEARDLTDFRLELLLFGVQSPINIGMTLRVAETYRCEVSIFDRHGVLDDEEKFKTIEDFGCGSVSRRGFNRLTDRAAVSRHCLGRRVIVTSILTDACALPSIRFRSGDLIVLGNEYDGLPEELAATADLQLHIPTPDIWTPKPSSWSPIDPARVAPVTREGTPNLNVAMSAGIICYTAYTHKSGEIRRPTD
jgi:tRNA G18 (ribose-2'-O)-methylase SpoU